jgi:hypothetical protein
MLFKQNTSICRTHALRGIVLTLAAGLALAQSALCASFGWDPNTETNIAGYRLYYGTASGNYTQSVDVGNVTQATLSGLTGGSTYYAAVAAYNTAALEGTKSTEVSFTAAVTTPASTPVVSLTSPTSGASFTAPATIALAATASETGGTIGYVEFYNGSTRVVTVTSAPYTFSLGSVAAGTYTFTARAYDSLGVSATSSPVTVTVAAATTTNNAPTVSLTSPANGASFTSPANITVTASASDSDGTVSKVEFYNGTSLVATATSSPYTVTFTGVTAGSYTLKAVAYDNSGASTTSSPVTVTVATAAVNKAPTVSLTSPASGASFTAPANITLTASASDSDGTVSKVEFYNGTSLIGTSTASPYTVTFAGAPVGSYTVTAVAYDNSGASTTSASVTVSVVAAVNKAPTVSLTSPVNGASFTAPASIVLSATASDSDGSISKVEFYNGTTKLGTSTASPYTYTWTGVAAGSYSVKAVAYDNSGASTTSTPAVVTVAAAATNKAPTVSLTSPANGTRFKTTSKITLSASASDSDGTISKVEFYNGSTLVATDTTSPYTATFTGVPVGTYTVKARAYDNKGASTTSAAVTVYVTR